MESIARIVRSRSGWPFFLPFEPMKRLTASQALGCSVRDERGGTQNAREGLDAAGCSIGED